MITKDLDTSNNKIDTSQILPTTSVGNLIIGTASETLNFDIEVAEIQLIHAVVTRTYK